MELQKAPTVELFMETPLMTYTDLGERCKEKFKIENAPSNAVIYMSMVEARQKEGTVGIYGSPNQGNRQRIPRWKPGCLIGSVDMNKNNQS